MKPSCYIIVKKGSAGETHFSFLTTKFKTLTISNMKISKILFLPLLGVLLHSCTQKISKETIDSYRSENIFFENSVSNLAVSKETTLKEIEDNNSNFMKDIDPKKKKGFIKDTALNNAIKGKHKCIIASLEEAEELNDSLKTTLSSNNIFIESLAASKLPCEEVEKQWALKKAKYNVYLSKVELLEADILEYKSQIYEIQKNALIKYGVQAPKSKLKNGNK